MNSQDDFQEMLLGYENLDPTLLPPSLDAAELPVNSNSANTLSALSMSEQNDRSSQMHNVTSVSPTIQNDDRARRQDIVGKIECIFENVADVLLEGRTKLTIDLHSRSSNESRSINFPGGTAGEAWRFAVLTKLLEIIHTALVSNKVVSKRDIYYRHSALFIKQTVVDKYVDDLAFTLGVSRALLNVSAAAKGLMAGDIAIGRKDGLILEVSSGAQGLLVPNATDIVNIDLKEIKHVLVLEKEASFRSIVSSKFWERLSRRVLIITAKGYPDLATRGFLHQIAITPSKVTQSLPVSILVDFDPDGIQIMNTYAFGSKSLSHETAAVAIPLESLRFMGLKLQHAIKCITSPGGKVTEEEILRLSRRDRRKAQSMIAKMADVPRRADGIATQILNESRRELQVMLMLNVKAEMQILEEHGDGTAGWIAKELQLATRD